MGWNSGFRVGGKDSFALIACVAERIGHQLSPCTDEDPARRIASAAESVRRSCTALHCLCHAMLCHAVLCCAMLCHAVPCGAVLCRAVRCHAVPCCARLCYGGPARELAEWAGIVVFAWAGRTHSLSSHALLKGLAINFRLARIKIQHNGSPLQLKAMLWRKPLFQPILWPTQECTMTRNVSQGEFLGFAGRSQGAPRALPGRSQGAPRAVVCLGAPLLGRCLG